MAYHRQQGVDTAIVRIFNTYGPRMRPHDGRAIPTFLRQALQNRPITVFGDGAADALVLLRRRPGPRDHRARRVGLPRPGEHRQPATSSPCLELAKAVIEVTGSQSRDRVRGAPNRRPTGAPAGHHPGAGDARLGAEDRAAARDSSARSSGPVAKIWSARPVGPADRAGQLPGAAAELRFSGSLQSNAVVRANTSSTVHTPSPAEQAGQPRGRRRRSRRRRGRACRAPRARRSAQAPAAAVVPAAARDPPPRPRA